MIVYQLFAMLGVVLVACLLAAAVLLISRKRKP